MTKLLRYGRMLYNWKVKRATVLPYLPEDVSVELTNLCNFACDYCPQSDPKHFEIVKKTTLSPEHARVLLSRIRAGGVRTNVIHWTLDGEPFVNKKIAEICGIAHEFGFDNIIFSTNGALASPDRLSQFPNIEGCRYTLCIDFCDDKEYFERYRGSKDSWEKVRDNVAAVASDARLAHIRVKVTDISSYKIHDHDELRRRFANLRAMFDPARVDVTSRVFHNATGHVKELTKTATKRYNLCPYPWMSFVVASNGDVVACCRDLQHKTVVGNLFEEEMLAIWNGEKYQQLRRSLVEQRPEGACKNCDMPWDRSKFTVSHFMRTGLRRLQVLH